MPSYVDQGVLSHGVLSRGGDKSLGAIQYYNLKDDKA